MLWPSPASRIQGSLSNMEDTAAPFPFAGPGSSKYEHIHPRHTDTHKDRTGTETVTQASPAKGCFIKKTHVKQTLRPLTLLQLELLGAHSTLPKYTHICRSSEYLAPLSIQHPLLQGFPAHKLVELEVCYKHRVLPPSSLIHTIFAIPLGVPAWTPCPPNASAQT